ncbi:hypothetical protein niasHT_022350 [Heterodera trifolii]|uniref:Uncharacterized protein n=1 Tax=Heterodera trifolii TaxID=157864 RepID=A0ABD2KNW7_9BILA
MCSYENGPYENGLARSNTGLDPLRRPVGVSSVSPVPSGQFRLASSVWGRVYERTKNGSDRTNNFAEAYHRTLQHAIGHGHPPIWKFINILRERQKLIDVDFEHFLAGNAPPLKAKRYREADRRILSILKRYNQEKAQPQINDDHQYGQNQNNPNLFIEMLRGISSNYQME